jgi:hypothetical protein
MCRPVDTACLRNPCEIIDNKSATFWKPNCFHPLMQVPRSGAYMPVAKITGQGLTSIAILVALLWTCVIGERVILGRANSGAAQVVRAMRELRFKTRREPAAAPARRSQSRPHPEVG